MKHMLLSLFMVCGAWSAQAETPKRVGWEDLTISVEFEDPFEDLTQEQLMELSIYARVDGLLREHGEKVSEAMKQEAEEARASLVKQGIDIEGLLKKRAEITELRMRRGSATNPALEGVVIEMPGYALPLEYNGKKVSEFLLVPWVGACIHTPPPPPNQIVHVRTAEPMQVKSRFEPVTITGKVVSGSLSKNLYLVDGASDIQIGYSMAQAVVEKYKSEKP